MTDEDLLEALEHDPEDGVRQVVDRHGPALLGRLRKHAHDRRYGDAEVEDVFQEAILRLIDPQKRTELRRAGSEMLPWLSRWGYWRLDDAARRRGVPLSELVSELAQPAPGSVSAAESPAVVALQNVLHLLSPRDRLVLRLRYAESRTNAQVADEVGITEGAAKKAAHDARERLRELIREAGLDLDQRG